jgi:DNA-binding transcriptional LysR family regulator
MDRLPAFDLVDLRLLLALAEHRHFAHAAKACNLSQPALSGRLRNLEEALGTTLVFRGKRFEGFTPDGEKALRWARLVLSDCGGLAQDLGADADGPKGILRIGVIPSATPAAGRLCSALAGRYPHLKPQVLSMSSAAIERGLQQFSIDAGISYLNPDAIEDTQALLLFEERYCLVANPGLVSSAGGGSTISWSEAADLPLCLLTSDMQNRRIIDQTFREAGKEPEPRFEANSFNAILALVREGTFATVLPGEQIDAGLTEKLKVLDLVRPVVGSKIGLIVPDRQPMLPVTMALWTLAKSGDSVFDK